MKTFRLLMTIIALGLFSLSCSNEELNLQTEEAALDGETFARDAEKVDVCHFSKSDNSYEIISVSGKSLEAHLNHGDVQLIDEDGDGYVTLANGCGLPVDCDDTDADVNPGATEICGNGVDDDCDGDVDEDCAVVCPCITIEELRSINWCDRNVQFVQSPAGAFTEPDGSPSPAFLVLQYNPATNNPFNQVTLSGPRFDRDGFATIRGNDPGNVFLNACTITFDETQACFDLVYNFAVNELGLSPTDCRTGLCVPTNCN